MTVRAHDRGPEELCEAGLELYTRAPCEGHVPARDADTGRDV
ncbi:hypothetical protein [Streptomyces sp. NPDC001340]